MCTGQTQENPFAPNPTKNWPNQNSVDMAIKDHESYLDPIHKYVNPDYAKEQNTKYLEGHLAATHNVSQAIRRGDYDFEKLKGTPIKPETSKRLMETYLAVQNNPIAKLGFDPSRILDTDRKTLAGYEILTAGTYNPSKDYIWDSGADRYTAVHESTHRGISTLIKNGLLSDDTIKFLNLTAAKVGKENTQMSNHELATRMLMLKYYGPVEAQGDLNKEDKSAIGNMQIRQAKEYSKFLNANASKRMRKALTEIQNAAKKENDALLPPGGAF